MRLPFNLGIGGAVQAGYRVAWDEGHDVAVQIDGDGQHRPDQLHLLVEALRAGRDSVVIGTRFTGHGDYRASRARRQAIRFLSRLVSRIVGRRLTDVTSGFRMPPTGARSSSSPATTPTTTPRSRRS